MLTQMAASLGDIRICSLLGRRIAAPAPPTLAPLDRRRERKWAARRPRFPLLPLGLGCDKAPIQSLGDEAHADLCARRRRPGSARGRPLLDRAEWYRHRQGDARG